MTLPSIPTLTTNGKRDALLVVAGLALLAGMYALGHHNGTVAARTAVDVAKEKTIDSLLTIATKQADSLTRVSTGVVKLATLAKIPHARAVVRTDSADRAAVYAREVARLAIADSAATNQRLRDVADSLIRADSLLDVRFHAERDAAMKRFMYDSLAMEAQAKALTGKDNALNLAGQDHKAQDKIIADLKGQQHGVVHRIIDGVLVVVATGGCAAAGSLLSPVGAIAAGGACLVAVATWAP